MKLRGHVSCDVLRNNEWLDATRHARWCLGQFSQSMEKAALIHITGVAHRCARQGVDVR
jgi:hypothetical protein